MTAGNDLPLAAAPSEEDLILFHYGEHPRQAEIAAALERSAPARAELASLRQLLLDVESAVTAPEPDAAFEARVWGRIEQRTSTPPGSANAGAAAFGRWAAPGAGRSPVTRWLALAAAVAGLVLGGFLAQRALRFPSGPLAAEADGGLPAEARQRILLAAATHHLERTERLLARIEHGEELAAHHGDEGVTVGRQLLADNRLYRIAAREAGDARLARFLEEIEPVLAELSHQPRGADFVDLRDRVRDRDLLFKLRVVLRRLGEEPRSRESAAAPNPEA